MTFPHRLLPGLAVALLLSWEVTLQAQSSLLESANRRRVEASAREETARRIAEAEARAALESSRLARESATTPTEDLASKAKAALLAAATPVSTAEQQRRDKAQASMDRAMQNLSPEARARVNAPVPVAQVVEDNDAPPPAPIVVAQNGEKVAIATPPPASAASGAPKPQPLKPTPLENPALKTSRTVITCSGSSFFDANKAIGIFTENVRVYHPSFYLECDELEVFMKKQNADPDKSTPKTDSPPAEGASPDKEDEDSSIEKVIARGAMVLIEKYTENGEDIQVGKCKLLTFDGTTKIVTLRVWPQVQRDARIQIAEEPSTYMTISPKGEFKSVGRSRTEFIQGDAAKPKTKGLRRAPEP